MKNVIEIFNYEGPVLSATKIYNKNLSQTMLYVITDEWKKVIDILTETQFLSFLEGKIDLIDTKRRRWNYLKVEEGAKNSLDNLCSFIYERKLNDVRFFTPKPTSSYEFNEKWKKYLEPGHYGLDIENQDVIDYLDNLFENNLSKVEGFTYSQIKTKFGQSRFYSNSNSRINEQFIEKQINKILNRENNGN